MITRINDECVMLRLYSDVIRKDDLCFSEERTTSREENVVLLDK